MPKTIFIIEDDSAMARCIMRAANSSGDYNFLHFRDAVSAMRAFGEQIPDLIFLDVLLNGPTAFALLDEMISYPDLAQIPIVLVSSYNLSNYDLSHYGVVWTLDKSTMKPADIARALEEFCRAA